MILAAALLAVALDKDLARDPTKARLQVRAWPPVALAFQGRPAIITVIADIVGPEDERLYCPAVAFIQAYGTNEQQESLEESDCVPFERRNDAPPPASGCEARISQGQFFPTRTDGECEPRGAPGFPRRWGRRYAFAPCNSEDGTCHYTVVVELRKAGRVVAREDASFYVR